MSAFLGPIHYWLFSKIKLQDSFNKEILSSLGDESLKNDLHRRYGQLEEGELAEIIDETNIHGWLQERVSLVENHLAYLTIRLKEKEGENLEKICGLARAFGNTRAAKELKNPRDAYDYLENLLLNGMPCDRVNAIVAEEKDRLVWERTKEIHAVYWMSQGADVADYYKIRKAMIEGIFEDSHISFKETKEGRFVVEKED